MIRKRLLPLLSTRMLLPLMSRSLMLRALMLGIILTLVVPSASVAATGSKSKESMKIEAATELLSDQDKLYGLSLYWKEASYNFAYFDQVPSLDFDAAYLSFIPKVLATKNTYEYYRELMKFNALLQDGHTNVYLPKGLDENYLDWPAITVTEVDRQAVITGVGRKLQSQIPLGSSITLVDDQDLASYLKANIMPFIASSTEQILWNDAIRDMLKGNPQSEVKIRLRTPTGEEKDLTLTRNARVQKSEMVSLTLPRSNGELFEFKWLGQSGTHDIAYMALNGFHDEKILADFYGAYAEIKQSKALIIDLRFNGGGNSDIAAEILSHFTDRDLKGAAWKTRRHIAAYKAWGKFYEEYQDYAQDNAWETGDMELLVAKKDNNHIVPTYVLIGRHTASAAEDFLIYADTLVHFTLVGENTYGSTGQPIFFDLPGGGQFRVCTKRDTYPDGRDFVGIGVKPDIVFKPKPQDLLSARDLVLELATQSLSQQLAVSISPSKL